MNKKEYKNTLEEVLGVIDSSAFYSGVEEMKNFDVTIHPNGVDSGVYCSKPNGEGWYEEEDWKPQGKDWVVYHFDTYDENEIKKAVKDYLKTHSHYITVEKAQSILIDKANKEQIEDRFYEFAQGLVDKYIEEIGSVYTLTDKDEVVDEDGGEMWYDDAKETAMKVLFERIAEMYK